jgi:hypothetical protein
MFALRCVSLSSVSPLEGPSLLQQSFLNSNYAVGLLRNTPVADISCDVLRHEQLPMNCCHIRVLVPIIGHGYMFRLRWAFFQPYTVLCVTFLGPCIVILYIPTAKSTRCTSFSNYLFLRNTLHVSDGLSVHHQEFKTAHTATGIAAGSSICLTYVCCCMYSPELLMICGKTVRNM